MASIEAVLVNIVGRYLKEYVQDYDPKQLSIGLWNGELTLQNAEIKREALDRFKLPVDVVSGRVGKLHLTWPSIMSLANKPAKIVVEDVYLLVAASPAVEEDPDEHRRRQHKIKMTRVEKNETLNASAAAVTPEDDKNQGFVAALTQKILDNLQVVVKNIHVRYEDDLSVPDHPFAIGFTLAELSAVSTDDNWREAFVANPPTGVHKRAKLDSMAVYFDTDVPSLRGIKGDEFKQTFRDLIARQGHLPSHQYILRPVTGEGRAILRKRPTRENARFDLSVQFRELGFLIDADQYRDTLSMIDLFHFKTRHSEYLSYHPPKSELKDNPARAKLLFALNAIRGEIHEKAYKWSWDHFRQRRDDRLTYVPIYKKVLEGNCPVPEQEQLEAMELRLVYRDILYFRSVARSQRKKEKADERERIKVQQAEQPANQGWFGWLTGRGGEAQTQDETLEIKEEDRQKLMDVIGYEGDEVINAVDAPKDAIKIGLNATLDTGSFALRSSKSSAAPGTDLIRVVFDAFSADVLKRTENLDTTLKLGGFRVFDGTVKDTKHPQIVRVKEGHSRRPSRVNTLDGFALDPAVVDPDPENPFFYVKYELKPLDNRAEHAVDLKMRPMEIVYHRGVVQDVVRFFKPPASQLESINALIDAASVTFDGIRQETTRAGLEWAFNNHKRIDLQVDMNAPIVIIPEDITKSDCQHVVLDAGRIAVTSELVDQEARDRVNSKQRSKEKYSKEDYKYLESVLYDKFDVRLSDTQLLIGSSLDECFEALSSADPGQNAHLLERISIHLDADVCIVNTPKCAKFKVTGELPDLHVNFSDRKYKTIMRMVDVAIPNFDDDGEDGEPNSLNGTQGGSVAQRPSLLPVQQPKSSSRRISTFARPSGFFGATDDDEEIRAPFDDKSTVAGTEGDRTAEGDDVFFEATDVDEFELAAAHQSHFEFSFRVGRLMANIFESSQWPQEPDRHLADAVIEGLAFGLVIREFDLEVVMHLHSMYLEDRLADVHSSFRKLITSEETNDGDGRSIDLVKIKYQQVKAVSPEFMSVHQGVQKTVDAEMSTLNVIFTRSTILTLYKWIMDTFASSDESPPTEPSYVHGVQAPQSHHSAQPSSEKMRVLVNLRSISFLLNADGLRLATLSLSKADVTVLMNNPTMRVHARLGDLSLHDDTEASGNPHFRQLLKIAGEELADFQYETFSREDATYPGHDASLYLRSGSLQFTPVEDVLHQIVLFLAKFAEMKSVMDRASAAARQQASGMAEQATKLHYDVLIRTPIIVFPRNSQSEDALTAYLGEFSAFNSFSGDDDHLVTKISAGIHNIRLVSDFVVNGEHHILQILQEVNVDVNASSFSNVDWSIGRQGPDTDVIANMSNVKMALTQVQYQFILQILTTVPGIFDLSELNMESLESPSSPPPSTYPPTSPQKLVADFSPELQHVARTQSGTEVSLYSKMEVACEIPQVSLELFDQTATDEGSLKNASLALMTVTGSRIKFRTLSDDSMGVEIVLKRLRAEDTRAAQVTRFREIMPGARHDGNQVMVSYSRAGADNSAMLHVELDKPSIIVSIDYGMSIVKFFTASSESTGQQTVSDPSTDPTSRAQQSIAAANPTANPAPGPTFSYRINISRPELTILANPERDDSDAVRLNIKQVCLSQQEALTSAIAGMGMSLCTMGRSDDVRFLDEVDLTASYAQRAEAGRVKTSVSLNLRPLIIRASPRDLGLIYSIYSKVVAISSSPTGPDDLPAQQVDQCPKDRPRTVAKASSAALEVSTEEANITIEGLQLILIGDTHQLPLFDFKTREIVQIAKDWSTALCAETTIVPYVNYFNLYNSHWEPLLDPWAVDLKLVSSPTTDGSPQQMQVSVSSQKRLELSITTAFIELALVTYSHYTQQGDQLLASKRGAREPYIIKNRTGYGLQLWAQYDSTNRGELRTLEDGADLPWRFEDWRAMRENVLSSTHDKLGLALQGTTWDTVQGISVIREGDSVYPLRPRLRNVTHRLLCHVEIHDNVKHVTFRSTFQLKNDSSLPIEMMVVDADDRRVRGPYSIGPGEACSVPIASAYDDRIKVRPNPGFGYQWCQGSYHWKELVKKPVRTIGCRSESEGEPSSHFIATTLYEKGDNVVRYYPKITVRLRAPVEVENLLPYDIKFRIYLKHNESTYSAFLRKGGSSPLHIAAPMELLLLSIEIEEEGVQGFKRSDYSIIDTDNPEDLPIENRLKIQDVNGLSLNLRLHYFRYPLSGGAFKVQIYCPYVIYNKTGLDFAIKSRSMIGTLKSTAGQGTFNDTARRRKPGPFLFNHPTEDRRNRALVRIGDSNWSQPVSFDVIGVDQQLQMASASKMLTMPVGVKVTEGIGEYKLTKVVTFYPGFFVKNMSEETLCFREKGGTTDTKLRSGERLPWTWLADPKQPQMVVALDAPINRIWSAPFLIRNVGKTFARLKTSTGGERLLRAEVLLQSSAIFIHLTLDPEHWPIVVRNRSGHSIRFGQAPSRDLRLGDRSDRTDTTDMKVFYDCPPGEDLPYTWDAPADNTGELRFSLTPSNEPGRKKRGQHKRDIEVRGIGTPKPLADSDAKVAFDVIAEGDTQIILVTDYDPNANVWKMNTPKVRNNTGSQPLRSDSQSTMTTTEFEADETEVSDHFSLAISLEGIGVSLIDKRLRELAYLSFRGIDFTLLDSVKQTAYTLIMRWIQFDNQLDDAVFPTWLHPDDLPTDAKALETRPNLNVSLIQLKDTKHGVIYIKYASVLLQRMAVDIDETSLWAVAAFSKAFFIASDDVTKNCLTEEPAEVPDPLSEDSQSDLYFEYFHLQPFIFVVSFERQDSTDVAERTFDSRNPVFFVLNALTMAIGSISGARLELNSMQLDDARMSAALLMTRLTEHYKSEIMAKAFRLLGSIDILGNPVGLFNNISSGVTDLFYEPYQGLVLHGGSDLGVSVARGAGRFVKGTATGIGESLSKITASFGKGLAAVTLDEEWQTNRRRKQMRDRHKINGFATGASAFVNGIASGVSGVALKPIQGGAKEGPAGVAKGIGRGMIGLVAKPTVGLLDFFSGATGTLRNAATIFDPISGGRARLPRHITHDGILRPYSAREAQGVDWLKNIAGGGFRNEKYVAHVEMPHDEDHVCILTTDKIILARMTKLQLTWSVPLSNLKAISLEPGGISTKLRDDNSGPWIVLADSGTKLWFFQHLKDVVNEYNLSRNMASGTG